MGGAILRLAAMIYELIRAQKMFVLGVGSGIAFSKDGWDAVVKAFNEFVIEKAAESSLGLELDSDDPLSDASLSSAITKRTGIAIRTLKDREMIIEDLLEEASKRIEQKTGAKFHNLQDKDQVIKDAMDFAVSKLGAQIGLVLTDPLNPEALKADIIAWGKEQVIKEVGEDLVLALSAEWSNGISLIELMRNTTGKNLTARDLMNGLNAVVVRHYSEKMERFNVATKADRRKMQNRINQRRFKERHKKGSATYDRSGIQVYIPVGWDFKATEREK